MSPVRDVDSLAVKIGHPRVKSRTHSGIMQVNLSRAKIVYPIYIFIFSVCSAVVTLNLGSPALALKVIVTLQILSKSKNKAGTHGDDAKQMGI